jgi:putative sterol carrier protein
VTSDTVATSDAVTAFFEELAAREHDPRLTKGRGTVCVELTNGTESEPWLVTIDRGDVTVLQGTGNADCTLRASRELFERVVTGDVNAVAAVLRGAIAIHGNWHLLVLFQRLFPSPPGAGATAGDTGAGGSGK